MRHPWRPVLFVLAQGLILYGLWNFTHRAPSPSAPTKARSEIVKELRARDLLVPVAGVERSELRSSFGDSRGTRRHQGIDISAPAGRPVLAVESGEIARMTRGKLSGRALHLVSEDGAYAYFYAHLQGYAAGLAEGATIRQGEVLGYVGSTGNAQTPHLHFTIRRLAAPRNLATGQAIDPYQALAP